MQAFVPKTRKPKFDLHLKIVDLTNVPLVSGSSFVKWHLPHSASAEHRSRSDTCPIKDHRVSYDYEKTVSVRLTVDKNGMLQESWIHFEVLQEYSVGGRSERISLGNVKLNLAEYVEQSEADGEEGVSRRYLMQDSKINSTLKINIFMKQTEGDKNFVAPPLKTAQVFGGIAGIMSAEQGESDESGSTPTITTKSGEAGELQDMYRRSLAAFWAAQPGELKADECIEDIFAGGDGWGDREKAYDTPAATTTLNGGSSGSVSESDTLLSHSRMHRGDGSLRKSHETLRPGDVGRSATSGVRGRGSLEQQAHHLKVEAERRRVRPRHEVDEFDVREDLRSWRLP